MSNQPTNVDSKGDSSGDLDQGRDDKSTGIFHNADFKDERQRAQDIYDSRAVKYDDSHHPRLARHFVELAKLRPGEHVLDLACGTGLVTFPAADAVGELGSVVGVDLSTGMLGEAKKKLASYDAKHSSDYERVSLYLHSISDLDSLADLAGRKFDVIICCSALVLLQSPGAALKHWTSYLKPGGRLIVDVTHPMTLADGTALERVGHRLKQPVSYYREPFQSPDDLKGMMVAGGLKDVSTTLLSVMDIPGTDDLKDYIVPDFDQPRLERVYDVTDANRILEEKINGGAYKNLRSTDDIRQAAKVAFKEEWKKLADADGKIREVDGIFVGIGHKEN